MEPLTVIAAQIASAGKLARAMVEVRDAVQVREKANELNMIIASMQESLFGATTKNIELLEKIRKLQSELAELRKKTDWQYRYEMHQPWEGCTSLYRVKSNHRKDGELAHYLCPTCFDAGRRSMLQRRGPAYDGILYSCPIAGCHFRVIDPRETSGTDPFATADNLFPL